MIIWSYLLLLGHFGAYISYNLAMTTNIKDKRVVIVGGGIHAASCAYYLSQKNIPSLIIERSSIACAASGKSGGFLAKNWGSGSTKQLHVESFKLHQELAKTLDIKSFRSATALSVQGRMQAGQNVASWLDRKVSSELMDTECGQVTPKELTDKLISSAVAAGSEVLIGTVDNIITVDNKVTGVSVTNHGIIPTENVIICMGPWSGVAVEDWFGLSVPLTGIKSTSLVYKSVNELKNEPFACFCNEDSNGCHLEMYTRVGDEMYVCGCGGSDYVSGDRLRKGGDCEFPESIQADMRRVEAAVRSLQGMTSLADRSPDVTQACMRPCTDDALPVMGKILSVQGAFCSFGHNCWGILWAPICG